MHKLYLLGISGPKLTPAQARIVRRCPLVVVPSRYAFLVEGGEKTILPMAPIKEMLAAVAEQLEKSEVAVLAGGDPLFYGIGRKMLEDFGPETVEIDPGLSSMQLAFSRFKESWDDAVFVSLHGRSSDNLARMLLPHRKVFVLTDRHNSPDVVAKKLLAHLRACGRERVADTYEVFVGENLGLVEERLFVGNLTEIVGRSFADLNVMILKRRSGQGVNAFPLGLKEEEITHSRGLITKDEVRAATLHRLRLPVRGVFWDIGAGSGSVAVEAARLCPQLDVFAVERNALELENIRANIRRYELSNVRLVEGEAPKVLVGLPVPDRVFIGGHGGKLAEIIRFVAGELAAGGRVVVNGVIEPTKQMAPPLLYDCGLEVTISDISISRRQYPATDAGSHTFNTIAVITGIK